ncbi:hypothetical protein [Flavobacterium mesophilum]|uniref:hypothetical protein n=1 Tax=Flavobacterium mesophilum TaxID=3143495 RepID=UPI0031D4A73C
MHSSMVGFTKAGFIFFGLVFATGFRILSKASVNTCISSSEKVAMIFRTEFAIIDDITYLCCSRGGSLLNYPIRIEWFNGEKGRGCPFCCFKGGLMAQDDFLFIPSNF